MSENSKIEWTDHTFNPWIGCTKVSPGCANCYAETQDKFRAWTQDGWGKGKPRRRTSEANWKKPLKWNAEAEKTGYKQKVFCASLADWLDDEVPIEWLTDLLELIRQTPNINWLLLTKRPENFHNRVGGLCDLQLQPPHLRLQNWIYDWFNGYPPINVWIGTSVEDQKRAEERIPQLINIPAELRFLSCEPLLSSLQLTQISAGEMASVDALDGSWAIDGRGHTKPSKNRIHWVIVGGESGARARPINPDWVSQIRFDCEINNTPFFFKQWGGTNKKANGRLLNGKLHNDFPTTSTPALGGAKNMTE